VANVPRAKDALRSSCFKKNSITITGVVLGNFPVMRITTSTGKPFAKIVSTFSVLSNRWFLQVAYWALKDRPICMSKGVRVKLYFFFEMSIIEALNFDMFDWYVQLKSTLALESTIGFDIWNQFRQFPPHFSISYQSNFNQIHYFAHGAQVIIF
jgi:hypothetical protein